MSPDSRFMTRYLELLTLTASVFLALLIGAAVGGFVGYEMGLKMQRTPPNFLSKPMDLRITVAGLQTAPLGTPQPIVLPSSGTTTVGSLFTLLAETAGAALRVAESKVKDVTKLPVVAAEEFTNPPLNTDAQTAALRLPFARRLAAKRWAPHPKGPHF